jgi:hypothetical protein
MHCKFEGETLKTFQGIKYLVLGYKTQAWVMAYASRASWQFY